MPAPSAISPTSNERAVLVGLVGQDIQASRTPRMHEVEGARLGLRYVYRLLDTRTDGFEHTTLEAIVRHARLFGFAGLNVTHPYKQAVIAHLDALAPEAQAIGAVNTVVFQEGRAIGHNTDASGFLRSLELGLPQARRARVLQFGAGGAGLAVAQALLAFGTAELLVHDVDRARAQALVERFAPLAATATIQVVDDPQRALATADGVVNATPIGMAAHPGTAFDTGALRPDTWVADIVYFPLETELLRRARALGCTTLAGAGMAVYQAVRAFELFTGIAPDPAEMTRTFESFGR